MSELNDSDVEEHPTHELFCEEYVSVWIALDDCTSSNGTFVVPNQTKCLYIDCSGLNYDNNNDNNNNNSTDALPMRTQTDNSYNLTSNFVNERKDFFASDMKHPGDSDVGIALDIKAGSSVLFSSKLWYPIYIYIYILS